RTIRTELRQRVGESTFDIWLAQLELQAFDGEALILTAPPGTRQWIGARYGRLLERCARQALGENIRVVFSEDASRPRRQSPPGGPTAVPAPPAGPRESFNPRYSFEQYIIGEGNRLAHAAALTVAELPGDAYNPLFLHAPPGLGKTHLLHAIGNYVQAFGGGAVIRYTTAEAFTNHFMGALSTKAMEPFKRAYRDADVLLIDDIQFLAAKARTEEEFFHTFNALREDGRQLVITCDRLPRALLGIEARLRERFEAGLVAEISPPDLATRVAILRKRAALDQITIADPAVLELIAGRVTQNIRALEGALIRVVAHGSLTQRRLDLELATEVMDHLYPDSAPSAPTIEGVQAVVAAHFAISTAELVSAGRTARIAWPRQVAIHLARDLTDASLQAIGDAFGGRNHGTVLHACKRVAERAGTDDNILDEVRVLAERVRHHHTDRGC
ncbi:MAG: chromosomal replication initiator protein DnaA, partial [Actinomycetota bacterium]|nr:chromosomal replication initiator protein DnaA [Actinomycetota bacterium]